MKTADLQSPPFFCLLKSNLTLCGENYFKK